jgi:hypothetical protein
MFHLTGSRVAAVEAVSSPMDFLMGRKLIDAAIPLTAEALQDLSVPGRKIV